jgi:hypothetical protein
MRNRYFGIVEGFYYTPYDLKQRLDLIKFLSSIKLDTYVYGPKQDIFHRKKWFADYPRSKMKEFRELLALSKAYHIRFNYALSPMQEPKSSKIIRKIRSMLELGITDFSLFFDDITVPLSKETAQKQAHAANELYDFLLTKIIDPVLFFCPTQYYGLKDTEYLKTIARVLYRPVRIFWTGPHVVSKRIDRDHIEKITGIIKRKPLIWDNLFANDYLPGVVLNFPYQYRVPETASKTSGILINPMNQYYLSKRLIYTFAVFKRSPYAYIPGRAWQKACSYAED